MKTVYANWTWGFTGSRTGWTDLQRAAVEEIWDYLPPARLHHGDCIGSDFNAHRLALTHEIWYTSIIIHPPLDSKYRAWCGGPPRRVIVLPTFPYGERNENIVRQTKQASRVTKGSQGRNSLLATPNSMKPVPHSGTWMTISIASRYRLPTIIVFPDGMIEYRQPTKLFQNALANANLKLHAAPTG